jgi:thioredoxin-related protein
MIKKILILAIFCFAFFMLCDPKTGSAVNDEIKWYSYDEGGALGKKDGKKIFLHFYADWCHFCTEMKKNTFTNMDVISYLNQNFICILVNADKERKIAGDYFVRGLPATFFLTADGNKIQLPVEENRKMSDIPGFISHEMLLKLLRYVQSESYNNMTFKAYTETAPAKQ